MIKDDLFQHSALAQILIDPYQDKLLFANNAAKVLFDEPSPSKIFSPSLPDFINFSSEVLAKSQAWSDQLICLTTEGEARVEILASKFNYKKNECISACIQKSDEIYQRREKSDAQNHYRSGIGHWNRVSKVFQEFERENQLLLDAAGEGIYGVDANGLTTFVNPAAQKILGYSAAELSGRNMHSMVHYHHPDGSHYHSHTCPIFAAFRDGAVHEVDDDVFWRKDGSPISVEYTSTPIFDNGVIVGAVVVFRDVTQKKANHQKLIEALDEVQNLKQQLELENAYLHEELNTELSRHEIVGQSPEVLKTIEQIHLVAGTQATVLIHGESGTGKELIARAIHDSSMQAQRAMIRVNCAAIPEDLFESEFFGHVKGAFTGAMSDRIGRFELANNGTLFLDEVGEIPLHLQGKLLRVLQEQRFEPVGGTVTKKVTVRILAATNKDLKKLVDQKKFREDLYFRLNVFPIESTPLRKRKNDIPALTQHFLKLACQRANKPLMKVPLSEIEKLKGYDWPGNIRELENIIERQVILNQTEVLRFASFSPLVQLDSVTNLKDRPEDSILTEREMVELDKANIMRALKACAGKVSGQGGAADVLSLKSTTLNSRIKKYQIDVRDYKHGSNGSDTILDFTLKAQP